MSHRIFLVLIALYPSLMTSGQDRVFRSAQSIRDGNAYAEAVHVDFGDEEYPSKVMDMLNRMPQLQTLVVGGPRFDDYHLKTLGKQESLRVLVLDSVDVSEKALSELQKSRPGLVVIRSQRLALAAIRKLARGIEINAKLSESHPEVRKLLGDRYFYETTVVNFQFLPDDENGPFDRFLNEQLAPIRMLSTLKCLDLSWSRLNDGGMYYLKPLTQLEYLEIPWEEVSADSLIHLRGMIHLRDFGGRIDDAGMRHLTRLKALETLRIHSDSEMTDAGLESIAELTNLKTLHLLSPRIDGSGLKHLAKLPDLRELVLGAGTRDISSLPEFQSLLSLTFNGAVINDEVLSPPAGCHKLESLSLNKTGISDKALLHLSGLTHLRYVSLEKTQVGDAGLAVLQKLPEVRYLNLSTTHVSNEGLARLRSFPRLEHLVLYNMPLNAEGIQNLGTLQNLKFLYATRVHESFPDSQSRSAADRDLDGQLSKLLLNCNKNQ